MADVCETIKDLLVTAGVGADGSVAPSTAFSIHISKLPGSPDASISIMQAGGRSPNPRWLVDYPSVQVMLRGAANGYAATKAKAQAVKDALLGIPSQDINGDRLVQINMQGDILQLGYDDKNRPMFSLNFSLIIEPASGTNRTAL